METRGKIENQSERTSVGTNWFNHLDQQLLCIREAPSIIVFQRTS